MSVSVNGGVGEVLMVVIFSLFLTPQCVDEEPPESLLMKELRRRGMSPTSLLEEDGRTSYGAIEDEDTMKEKRGDFSRRSAVSTDYEKSLTEQRQRSMALNSEGLEVTVNFSWVRESHCLLSVCRYDVPVS